MEIKTIEVAKGEEVAVINATDAPAWLEKGWKPVIAATRREEPARKVDWSGYSIPELKKFAARAGVAQGSRAAVEAALTKKGFKPQ